MKRLKPKNEDQKQALVYLNDPEIDLVILEGVAGSGKTFLALASGLNQVLKSKLYKEIIFTRAPVSLGNDLGSLPGTEEEKLGPWCGALKDNLEVLGGSEDSVKICAMQFMRGRSFMNKYVIIDEAQNLSESELKVLLTRAGEGTKIVIMGDTSQIDNRRLTKDNNALANILSASQHHEVDFVKHVYLPESERSRLCKWASLI